MTAQNSMPHRGRFQAQGNNTEKSKNWSQETSLPAPQAHDLLNALCEDLNPAERRDREVAFAQAHEYIETGATAGGIGPPPLIKKTFPRRVGRGQPRVDIEVLAGLAFVPAS